MKKTEMARSTVNGYLADFVATEKPATIFAWVPEDVCERVAVAAEMHGTAALKPIFLELNQEVSYEHIRVVLAFLQASE
jgi:ATP-dependent DNA helicase RecQ